MNLASIDLNLLVVFERLLATGSVTVAARELGVTQPALSRSLQRLRDLLGDPLFVRAGRGLTTTPRARELHAPLIDALDAVRMVITPPGTFDPRTATGPFVLAMGDENQVSLTDAIIGSLAQAVPGVDIRIRALTPATVEDARHGRVDLAISPDLSVLPATAGGVDLSEFHRRQLYIRHFVVASSAAFPRPALTLAEYAAADHIIVSFEGGGRGFVDDLLAERGLWRRVAASVTSFHSAASVVARTRLLVTLPEEVARAAAGALVWCAPPLPLPTLSMLLLWHPRVHASPRHRYLRDLVAGAVLGRIGSTG